MEENFGNTTKKSFLFPLIIVIIIVIALLLFTQSNNPQANNIKITTELPLVLDEPYKSNWDYGCPNLSNLKILDNLAPDDSTSLAWLGEQLNYNGIEGNISYTDLYFVDETRPELANKKLILCDTGGIDFGTDPNRIYCGSTGTPIILSKPHLDGNDVRTSVQVIFDTRTQIYLETKCGVYDISNAP